MPQRIKYPLTQAAKESARQLVEAWNSEKIDQLSDIMERKGNGQVLKGLLASYQTGKTYYSPRKEILFELAEYKLVELIPTLNGGLQLLLLQELRNAVESDFDVSDFFLTTSAVGTIIHGDLIVREGANFQSAASNFGDITQNIEQIVEALRNELGNNLLKAEPELDKAITELESSTELTRNEKLGSVIQELGRCLQHVANTQTVIGGLVMLAKFLG